MNQDAVVSAPARISNMQSALESLKAAGGSFAARAAALSPNEIPHLQKAYEEFLQRHVQGDPIDADDYAAQFPAFQLVLLNLLYFELQAEELYAIHEPASMIEACREGQFAAVAGAGAWPRVGATLQGSVLLRELGRGSFARAYLARQPRLGDRLVVLKLTKLPSQEAKILGRIQHPNIVPVLDVQENAAPGLTAVWMPYAGSSTFCHVLAYLAEQAAPPRAECFLDAVRDQPWPLERTGHDKPPARILQTGTYLDGVAHLGAQMADALAFIHQRDILHLDLKPANVLLSPAGVPMLLDFNLALPRADDLARTRLQANFGGTIPYMSPEQLRAMGELDRVVLDHRADLFSLGVLLYVLATGAHPFDEPLPERRLGASATTVPSQRPRPLVVEKCRWALERQGQGFVPASRRNPRIDHALNQLIQRCLALDPKQRPQSAGEVAAALRRYLTPHAQTRRWIARHPAAVALTSVALFLGGTVMTGAWLGQPPYTEQQYKLGVASYQQGQFKQAVHHFDLAIEADPKLAPAHFARGQAYLKLAADDQSYLPLALANFKEADHHASDGRTKAALGYCLQRKDDKWNARQHYLEAIKAGYLSAGLCNNLGCLQVQLGHYKEAEAPLDRALKLDDRLQAAYHNRALLAFEPETLEFGLEMQQKSGLARDALQAEVQKLPLVARQRLQTALRDIDQALKLGPVSRELALDAARLYRLSCLLGGDNEAPVWLHLQEAVKQGLPRTWLAKDARFQGLRNDPRFKALLAAAPEKNAAAPSRRMVDLTKDF